MPFNCCYGLWQHHVLCSWNIIFHGIIALQIWKLLLFSTHTHDELPRMTASGPQGFLSSLFLLHIWYREQCLAHKRCWTYKYVLYELNERLVWKSNLKTCAFFVCSKKVKPMRNLSLNSYDFWGLTNWQV